MRFPGSQQRMQQLVDAHYASLYRYAVRLSGSHPEAEDLTQETFCQAQMKLHQLRDDARTRAWLFSILRNAYLRRRRDDKHAHALPLDWVGDVPDRLTEPLPEIDAEQLQLALSELAEEFRTPLILFYFEDFSYRDIAEQMSVPIGTVMSRLARAKAHLRTRLLPGAPVLAADQGRVNHGM